MKCSNCGFENGKDSRFCMSCGSPLPVGQPSQQAPAPTVKGSFPPAPQPPAGNPPSQLPPVPAGTPQPYAGMPPQGAPAYPNPGGQASPAGTVRVPPYTPPAQPGQPAYQPMPQQPPYPPQQPYGYAQPQYQANQGAYPLQQGTTGLNIWGPFAGYGTRRHHLGWLMDNKGDRAQDLITKVNVKFTDRSVPGAHMRYQVLTGRGLLVENRPYFMLNRGLVNVGLNITQFGKDLFISIASYLKPPISNLRVLLVGVMLLFALFTTFVLPSAVNGEFEKIVNSISGMGLFGNSGAAPNTNGLIFLVCVLGPLGLINNLALFLLFCYSIWKFIREKDILAGLRTSPNEFNEDDLMAMEKAVEQTVRISIDEIGLDANALKPVASNAMSRLI